MAAFARRGLTLAGAALLVCCRAPPINPAFATADQQRTAQTALNDRVRAFKRDFPGADIQLDPSGARVILIQRLTLPARSASAEDMARDVLRMPALAAVLGLSRDLRELCAPIARADPQVAGYAVVRMRQCVEGVPVLGAEVVMNIQAAPSPAVDSLASSLVSDAPARATPTISRETAARAAAAGVEGARAPDRGRGGTEPAGEPAELVVFAPSRFQLEGPTRLCWLVRVARMTVLVDARTGAIVHQYSQSLQ